MGTTTGKTPGKAGSPRRADAERNIAAILAAAARLLSADPNVSVAEIAKEAGVGRVTLYGHFPSRESLVDAVLQEAVDNAEAALSGLELDALPAAQAMDRLIGSSWEILDRHRRLFVAADRALPAERIRERHGRPLARVERLVERGMDEGAFRTDLPLSWLVTTFFALLHNAAGEIEAGRLPREVAADVLTRTLRSVLAA
ncbi:TetR/AcrR family transcriptional regulator [Nonomuraea sp. NPDC003804]|uniref:TetR/AcrR family transcriptional regulator n=1 Tax=Nonomuraea sp. NPDC003804 TaxID=3154547 RepID=UPI0033BDCB6F